CLDGALDGYTLVTARRGNWRGATPLGAGDIVPGRSSALGAAAAPGTLRTDGDCLPTAACTDRGFLAGQLAALTRATPPRPRPVRARAPHGHRRRGHRASIPRLPRGRAGAAAGRFRYAARHREPRRDPRARAPPRAAPRPHAPPGAGDASHERDHRAPGRGV